MRLHAPLRPPPQIQNIPPQCQNSIRLIFLDGHMPCNEIELNAKEHVSFWEHFYQYREISGRQDNVIHFEYEGRRIISHDTPASLRMAGFAQIHVFPPDPETNEATSEDNDGETEAAISLQQGVPLQPEEDGTIISDQNRIISILKSALSNQTSFELFAMFNTLGGISLMLNTIDNTVFSPPAPMSSASSSMTLVSSPAGEAAVSAIVTPAPPVPKKRRGRGKGLNTKRARKARAAAAKAKRDNAGARGGRYGSGGK